MTMYGFDDVTRGRPKAVAIQEDNQWRAFDLDPADEDLDALTDAMRNLGDGLVVAFVEEDNEYLAIIQMTRTPRIPRYSCPTGSIGTSALAEALLADTLPLPAPRGGDDEDEDDAVLPHAQPIGDLGLLDDLGTPRRRWPR